MADQESTKEKSAVISVFESTKEEFEVLQAAYVEKHKIETRFSQDAFMIVLLDVFCIKYTDLETAKNHILKGRKKAFENIKKIEEVEPQVV